MALESRFPADDNDEFIVNAPRLRDFIGQVKAIRARLDEPEDIIEAIRPAFAALLADSTWLPDAYQATTTSGMGQDIGTWLLYRAKDGSLALSSLVVAPGVETPVHDHLAWGLVGLYRGGQAEDVYARQDDGSHEGTAKLTVVQRNQLKAGEFYALLPHCDIHRVRTTSDVTSVSLHLLGIDNGCIWRHRFFPDEERVVPFRSGYVNVDCEA